MDEFISQLRRNQVALLSLVVSLTALCYAAWRNEQTEENRNVRAAGFAIIEHLAELDRTVFFVHYEPAADRTSAKDGWAQVLAIRDYADIVGDRSPVDAAELARVWNDNVNRLGADHAAARRVSEAIDRMRVATRERLRSLT